MIAPTRRACLAALAGVAAFGACGGGLASRATPAPAWQLSRPRLAALPRVPLLAMTGEPCRLDLELAPPMPLALNFVFTTCSSSCSAQTAVLVQVQQALRARGAALQLASITIDPDNDTPQQLREFARRFGIGAGWQFYTGRFDDLLRVQKHFDVYRGSKASHPPVLLLRQPGHAAWLRVEGFPTPPEVVTLIEQLPREAG